MSPLAPAHASATPPEADTGEELHVAAPPAPDACLHCGADRLGDYCHACGQQYAEGRLTIRGLAREFAERFLKLERGVLGTFLGLCRAPGRLARAYVEGHRRPYVNPLSYVFLGAAATLLLLPWMFEGGQDGYLSESIDLGMAFAESMSPNDRTMTPQEQAAYDDGLAQVIPLMLESLDETMRQLNAVFAFVAALIMAALFRLFFGARSTYAEAAVPALYITGHYFLLAVPLALATLWLPNGIWIYTALSSLVYAGLTVWTALGFYGRSWGTAGLGFVSFVGTYLLYTFGVMALASVVSMWRVMPEIQEIIETTKAAHGL